MTGEVVLGFILFFACMGLCLLFLKNMHKRDKEKSDKFFAHLKTEEGQKQAEDLVKAFEAVRTINRRSKAGKPLFEDTKPPNITIKPDLDQKIDEIINRNRGSR